MTNTKAKLITMLNTGKFAKRLQKILDYYELSAAAFADEIDVGRSSISHILSGRNKPSLDFVMKVVSSYPEVELYWLLNGKGNFPAQTKESEEKTNPAELFAPSAESASPVPSPKNTNNKIKKIVLFYENGSFEVFENN